MNNAIAILDRFSYHLESRFSKLHTNWFVHNKKRGAQHFFVYPTYILLIYKTKEKQSLKTTRNRENKNHQHNKL
jgi:hypothetical protein